MSGEAANAGLCASCSHAQIVTSARGSTFYLCQLSFVDPRFAKYPVLPVKQCAGYEEDVTPPGGSRRPARR